MLMQLWRPLKAQQGSIKGRMENRAVVPRRKHWLWGTPACIHMVKGIFRFFPIFRNSQGVMSTLLVVSSWLLSQL